MTSPTDLTARVDALIYHMGESRTIDTQDRETVIDMRDEIRALSAALQQMTAIKDIHQVKRHQYFERSEEAEAKFKQAKALYLETLDRAVEAESERDALKAELAESLMNVADLYRLHRRSGPKWDHEPTKQVMDDARAFIDRHQKEIDT